MTVKFENFTYLLEFKRI